MLPKVLFVDDDPSILAAFKANFRKLYDVHLANGGPEALGLLASGRQFAAIVSDVRMPGMSGLEFLELAREIAPRTSRIVLTGHADLDMACQAVNQGHIFKFLTKPCGFEDLKTALEAAIAQTADLRFVDEGAVRGLLAAMHFRNLETRAHVDRVGQLSALLASTLGWTQEHAETLRRAATMHDLGKIAIPDSVLLKPGKLTTDEYDVMKTHARIGGEMLSQASSPLLRMAREIADSHHERPDGTGYPNRLSGQEIPHSARIVSVADVYDALVSERVYRGALPPEQAQRYILEGRGSAFDTDVVDAFTRVWPAVAGIYSPKS